MIGIPLTFPRVDLTLEFSSAPGSRDHIRRVEARSILRLIRGRGRGWWKPSHLLEFAISRDPESNYGTSFWYYFYCFIWHPRLRSRSIAFNAFLFYPLPATNARKFKLISWQHWNKLDKIDQCKIVDLV